MSCACAMNEDDWVVSEWFSPSGHFSFWIFYLHKVIYLMKVYTSRFVLVDVRSYIFRHTFFSYTWIYVSGLLSCHWSTVRTRSVFVCVHAMCVIPGFRELLQRCFSLRVCVIVFCFFHNRGHCFDKVISPPRGFYLLKSVSWTQLARNTSTGQTRDINCVSCPKPECIATVSCVSHTNIGALYEHSGYIYILWIAHDNKKLSFAFCKIHARSTMFASSSLVLSEPLRLPVYVLCIVNM